MSRTFVIGDIHGAFRALKQCLERASFDYENDRLIALGDVCDGWPETKECVDELMKIKNLIFILGNHDMIMLDWMETGQMAESWFVHGGEATCLSYGETIPRSHIDFIKKGILYHLEDNKLFVHAGILPDRKLEQQGPSVFMWDRTLAGLAMDFQERGISKPITEFDEIFIGHTPIASSHPRKYCEVWMMDTGAGWYGPLSMMNVHSKEFFISDPVTSLYPGITGRTKKVARP
jgi:serine/threonine protein phosphatase 1